MPLKYVVVGVTLYCAVAWTVAIAGINVGMQAIKKQPEAYADSQMQKTR